MTKTRTKLRSCRACNCPINKCFIGSKKYGQACCLYCLHLPKSQAKPTPLQSTKGTK